MSCRSLSEVVRDANGEDYLSFVVDQMVTAHAAGKQRRQSPGGHHLLSSLSLVDDNIFFAINSIYCVRRLIIVLELTSIVAARQRKREDEYHRAR